MTSPAYVLREASVYLDETLHLLADLEEYDPWTPLEQLMGTLILLRWVLDREVEEVERPEPPLLHPM